MVPSSLLSLILFIALLAPGLAYLLRLEQVVPTRAYSVFRETLRVVFVSVACLIITGLVAAGARYLFPEQTVNVGELVRNPSDFARENYGELTWWILLLLVIATGFGALAADARLVQTLRAIRDLRLVQLLTGSSENQIRVESAWYHALHLFDKQDPGPIRAGAQMDDGTYIEGWVHSFGVTPEETADRELLLHAPLKIRTTDGKTTEIGAQFTIISARHITRLDITHLPAGYNPQSTQGTGTKTRPAENTQPV